MTKEDLNGWKYIRVGELFDAFSDVCDAISTNHVSNFNTGV